MTNDLSFYNAALAGQNPEIHPDTPHPGYYRMRAGRGGAWLPVAIWHKDGALVARVADEMRDPLAIWTFCGGNPVTKDACTEAFKTGQWPGDAPEIGHNSANASIGEQIRDYASMALDWLRKTGITNTAGKDRAANLRARLLELRKLADSERDAKKRPHDEAARAIQAEYKPLIDEANAAADELRAALTTYMNEEDRKERARRAEEHRKEQERVAAERARIEKDRAEKLARDPIAAMTDPEPELPADPAPPAEARVRAGGQRGRATGLRSVTTYVVTDYAATLAHVKDHPEVIATVEKVARAQAKAGAAVPGVEARTEKVAA